MRKLLILISVLVGFVCCENTLIGPAPENNPLENFEEFWTDIDEHYGLFLVRGWDWDSIYNVYQPQVPLETTDEELWSYFKEMITYLDDSHTFIFDPESEKFFASGSDKNEIIEEEFSIDLLKEKYVEKIIDLNLSDVDGEQNFSGKVRDKDIAYLYLSEMEADDHDFMDEVIERISGHKALIFDIRNNAGGSDELSAEIAGRFAKESKVAFSVQTRNGVDHSDFTKKSFFSTEVKGEQQFTKPIVLLTDKITVSAAESLGLYMKQLDDVTQIGDSTAGDFSDVSMRRFLPNGWQFQYSIMMYLQPDGSSLDGIGNIPDVLVRNSKSNIELSEDKVIEKAIEYLFEVYGIE